MIRFLSSLVILLLLFPHFLKSITDEVYTDALASGWSNWSWAQVNLVATNIVHSGIHSIAVIMDPWEGLYLHNSGARTLGITNLRFFVHGGVSGGQMLNVFLNLEVNDSAENGPFIPFQIASSGSWQEVLIPLDALNPNQEQVTGITWQSASGSSQPVFYIDDIAFISQDDPQAPQIMNLSLSRRSVPADGQSSLILLATVQDPQGQGNIREVQLNSFLPGQRALVLQDDGFSSDGDAGDGVFGVEIVIPVGTEPGELHLLVSASDQENYTTSQPLGTLVVLAPAGGTIPATLPQQLGWGSNQWSETTGADWQVNSGVPWDYVYQYITYGWENWGDNFVSRFVNQAWQKDFIPVVTVYLMLDAPTNCGESPTCYADKLQNAGSVNAYIDSLVMAAQQAIGTNPVIFVLEPDFYGYMQQLSNDPYNRPSGVVANDPSSYPVVLNRSGYANNLAGFGKFIVDRIHQVAENALVAPMASMWATGGDPQNVTTSQAMQMAQSTAVFINAMGGVQSDLLTVEFSDRDAGFYEVVENTNSWWDDEDLVLPRVNRALLWGNTLSKTANKRLLLWQVPAGNMGLDNTCDHYQDNRPAYLFTHARDVFESGVLGVVFGGGATCTTNVNTDGGFIAAQGEIAYDPPTRPAGLEVYALNDPLAYLRWQRLVLPDLWGYSLHYRLNEKIQVSSLRLSQRTSTSLYLPAAGLWEIWLTSRDAMGQESSTFQQCMGGDQHGKSADIFAACC